MIFVYAHNMEMKNRQKGTILCIKQLIFINFFRKFFDILLHENYLIIYGTNFCISSFLL